MIAGIPFTSNSNSRAPNKQNMKLEKAKLIPFNGEPGEPIELMFNPTQLSFARNVKWQSEQGNRGNSALPKVNFSGVDPFKLTISQLVFDTYETRESVIERYIKKLKKSVESPDGKNKRPPVYVLQWGQKKTFPCVVVSLSYKLDMFLPDGTPVRALVDISLQEVEKENLPGDNKSKSSGRDRQKDGRSEREKRRQGQQPSPMRSSNIENSDY